MNIRFHQEALREYDKAILWYAKRSLVAPFNFVTEVDSMVERIAAVPFTFPIVHDQKRKAVLSRFPFYLIFTYEPDAITIYAVGHAKRKTAYWRRRRM